MNADPCPSWSLYRAAVFRFERRPAWAEFGIVTAWNPLGVARDRGYNDERDEDLRRALELSGFPAVRVFGCSPDLAHQEPGWAAPLSCEGTRLEIDVIAPAA